MCFERMGGSGGYLIGNVKVMRIYDALRFKNQMRENFPFALH